MKKAILLPFFGMLLLLTFGCVPGNKEAITPQPTHMLSPVKDTPAISTPIPSPTEAATQSPTEPPASANNLTLTGTSTSSPPPGLDELAIPYVGLSFLVDPGEWDVVMEFDNVSGDYFILHHQEDKGCQINMPPERPFYPMTSTFGNFGGRNWVIYDNLRFKLVDNEVIVFNLHAPSEDCRAAQVQVLGTLREIEQRQEFFVTETPLPTPTSLADSDFDCPGVPPIRLRIGMAAKLINGEPPLLLSPVTEPGAVAYQLSPDEDLTFYISGGPECLLMEDGTYLYWKVSIYETWEIGWVAEGTGDIYFLEPYTP